MIPKHIIMPNNNIFFDDDDDDDMPLLPLELDLLDVKPSRLFDCNIFPLDYVFDASQSSVLPSLID